jgi:hypothetical protein
VKNVAILVAVFLGGIGVNTPTAEADLPYVDSVRVDVSQLHEHAKNLPVQRFHEMSLVFPGGD